MLETQCTDHPGVFGRMHSPGRDESKTENQIYLSLHNKANISSVKYQAQSRLSENPACVSTVPGVT